MIQEIPRRSSRTILELWVGWVWARLDDGKTWVGEEMWHKKMSKFWWKFDFWRFFENDPRSTPNHSKTKKTEFQRKKQWFLNKMVRSTLLHLPLCGAFGWFWRPRAGACFWHFDTILLIEIFDKLRNPCKAFPNYVRALSWLNIRSIGWQKPLGCRENVSRKNVKILMKFWIFGVFSELIPDKPWTVPRPKKHNFNTKIIDF